MARWISLISLIFLVVVGGFFWGWRAQKDDLFPAALIKEVEAELRAFAEGGEADGNLTLSERIESDFFDQLDRQLAKPWIGTSRSYWPKVADQAVEIDFPEKSARRANPVAILPRGELFESGYLFLFGAFDSKSGVPGGLLLDHSGRIIHHFSYDDEPVKAAFEELSASGKTHLRDYALPMNLFPIHRRFPHGVELLPDGSLIFNDGDSGNAVRRIDWCGEPIWTMVARSHHSLELQGDRIWYLEGYEIVAASAETGEVTKRITFDEIVGANRDKGALEIRKVMYENEWLADPFHANDLEPLSADLAAAFPGFEEGDLLLSLRSLDMVMVVDPDSLEMKWWRLGATRRQNDPDWQANGRITVFDNLMEPFGVQSLSRILEIDPKDMSSRVLFEGSALDAYSAIRGRHQVLPDGSILLTLSQQGRALLVSAEGEMLFDFYNRFNEKFILPLADAVYLPPNYFEAGVLDRVCGE